jgi:hypothetical protein
MSRPEYREPTGSAGSSGGAAQPLSPSTPPLLLAGIVFVCCGIGAAATPVLDSTGWVIAFCAVALVALAAMFLIGVRSRHGGA